MKARKKIFSFILGVLMASIAITMILPFIWTLSASFKFNKDVFAYPTEWIPKNIRVRNYVDVWTKVPFLKYFLNTFKITIIVTAGQLVTCSMAAYSFSKLEYPGRDKIFLAYLATLMVPWHAIMIPQFIVVNKLGLYNTHMAIIAIQLFNALGVFLMRQFMLGISKELSESAIIDGCNHINIFFKIIMPLSKPGLATLTVLTFTFMWNDYLAPMLYLDTDSLKTIQLGLASFRSMYTADYNLIMAGTVNSMIPILIIFILAQKYLMEGISFTGIKG